MVVSVHPLCQDIPLKILSELDDGSDNRSRQWHSNYGTRLTPFVTVVTDLGGAHKTWFNPAADKVFVPSDVLHKKARSCGSTVFPSERPFGVPTVIIEPMAATRVAQPHKKVHSTKELGLDERPTVLVVGGGDGMGGIVDMEKRLLRCDESL